MNQCTVTAPETRIKAHPILPSSKSVSNRLLILNALSEFPAELINLSDAVDTVTLRELLERNQPVDYCGDGGTTFRFLLALRCVQNKLHTLTGSAGLSIRPVKPLLDALRQLGAEFEFPEKEETLPVRIKKGISTGGSVSIQADISSQFISALMMIAPVLPGGLVINMSSPPASRAYLQTTLQLMETFGVKVHWMGNQMSIAEQRYIPVSTIIGADWSSAGYWYAIAACLPGTQLLFNNLHQDGLQPDEMIISGMKAFGVQSENDMTGITIRSETVEPEQPFQFDFTQCPDLAQTFAVTAAVTGIGLRMTGLSTLPFKETDRINALKTELEKTGVNVSVSHNSMLIKGKADKRLITENTFDSWKDHRMVMALAVLSGTGAQVRINNPGVVEKSYPRFFDELKKAGFGVTFI